MTTMRILIIRTAIDKLSMGLTIGLRYALVRTQFKDKSTIDGERPLIEYQTQQH